MTVTTGNGAGTAVVTAALAGGDVAAVAESSATTVVPTPLTSEDGVALGEGGAASELLKVAPTVLFVSLQAALEVATSTANTNRFFRTIPDPSHVDSAQTLGELSYDVGSAIVAIARQFSS